jgi:hypothetical protein
MAVVESAQEVRRSVVERDDAGDSVGADPPQMLRRRLSRSGSDVFFGLSSIAM